MATSKRNATGLNEPASKRPKSTGFVRPSDWPAAGAPLDLAVQDLPHDTANTEWWYVNGHLKSECGKEFSFFASFFRAAKADAETGAVEHAHALNWGIVDASSKKYYPDPILDCNTPKILKHQLLEGGFNLDARLKRAMLEVVEKGNVPLPDHLFSAPAKVSREKLSLAYDANIFSKDESGNYHVHCENKEKKQSFSLDFVPKKKPVLQGHEGVVQIGIDQETMFYYFIPRNDVTGTLEVEGKQYKVQGSGWYDHEFGGEIKKGKTKAEKKKEMEVEGKEGQKKKRESSYAWNWLSVQFEDGTDLTATTLVKPETKEVLDNFVVLVHADGERHEHEAMELTPEANWVSIRTTHEYPTHWSLTCPEAKLSLKIEAAFEGQEIITLISKPAFWEGRVHVTGSYQGREVKGLGFVERHGFQDMSSLDGFFKRISKQVMHYISKVLPLKPTYEEVRLLLANKEYDHFMSGVDCEVYRDTIIKPLRDIVDRGGKSWRSFAFLLCVDCVGGDSNLYKAWLAMPEIMHVGSLIVDDIQDKSETRRGGPSCHKVYGDAIAINAGTAGYFLSLDILQSMSPDIPNDVRLRMYELYFLTLRAGHAGQAFDINGLEYLMPAAVESGNSAKLEEAVLCTHRLKSAVPAGNLARMGTVVGKGNDEQVHVMGMYFESIGLAFQIIDDVLNLRGFKGNVKARGEDIVAGKVTFPVAKAMGLLEGKERTHIWNIIKSKPENMEVVEEVINIIEKCGALDASVTHATRLVDEAWEAVDKLIPDSFYKLLLRAFGWYVLERHY